MGFLDKITHLFSPKEGSTCISCGSPGAQKTAEGQVRCPSPSCVYFEATMALHGTTLPTRGNFEPVRPLAIRYRNFAGQERSFVVEADSVVRRGNHLVVRVAPTGKKIALARDRMQNLQEVEAGIVSRNAPSQTGPSPRERQVLGFHKKHKSSSPLFEKIRAKYPDW